MLDVTFGDRRMLIGGELVAAHSGAWLESTNPANEQPIGRVPNGDAADIDAAVTAALHAQPDWAARNMQQRASPLRRLAAALTERGDEIARMEVMDTGNTIGPMRRDVDKAVERIHFYAGLGSELKGETFPVTSRGLHLTVREPYGVVGRIIPYNHPLGFAASRLAPALMAGNAIVIKPSEQSPLSACVLAELCRDIFPPGLVNIVTGGPQAGEALARHPAVKRIAFIGSRATGMAIQRAAAETAVKHVTLELGGKNPLIVCPDADLDQASAAAVRGMNFAWQGQSCGSTSRLFLHDDIYDRVLPAVVERIAALTVGDPLDPASDMGPINSATQIEKVLSYVAWAQEDGARLLTGGERPAGPMFERGYWIRPTVFADVTMAMRVARGEVFGPVLSVLRWRELDEVVDLANDVEYGLTASIWTRDLIRGLSLARRINAGYVWLNGTGTHFRGVPFGGAKNSGIGREEGIDELLSYTECKAINVFMD